MNDAEQIAKKGVKIVVVTVVIVTLIAVLAIAAVFGGLSFLF